MLYILRLFCCLKNIVIEQKEALPLFNPYKVKENKACIEKFRSIWV